MDVEQHGAAGVAVVGHVDPSPSQTPDQKGIDGPEQDLAALGPSPQPVDRVEQVTDLRAGEVRIDHEPGLAADELFMSV